MKKFVNFKFVVMFALALVANVASYAQDNVIDEVVWVIGDEAILKSDVEEARLAALYEGRKFDGDHLLCDSRRVGRTETLYAPGCARQY